MYLFKIVFIPFLMLSCVTLKHSKSNAVEVVASKMKEQESAWNEGDIEGFMKHYWKSDSLTFIGKSGVNYGWNTTLNNYKKSYKTVDEMGKLTFKNSSIQQLSDQFIYVIGKWHLKRANDLEDLEGHYTLIWKRIKGNWVIVSDHSS